MLYHRYYRLIFKNRLYDVFITLTCQAEHNMFKHILFTVIQKICTHYCFCDLEVNTINTTIWQYRYTLRKKHTQYTQMINTSLCTIGWNIFFFNQGYTNVDYSYTNRGVTRKCSNWP